MKVGILISADYIPYNPQYKPLIILFLKTNMDDGIVDVSGRKLFNNDWREIIGTGRLLMNFILHKNGFPMINIPNLKKTKYYDCLQEAQIKGNLEPMIKFLFELLQEQNLRF